MNILCISPVYPSKKYPNSVVFVHKQVQALVEAGHSVIVIDIDLRSLRWVRKAGFYKDEFQGITVYRCSWPTSSKMMPSGALAKLSEISGLKTYKKIIMDGFQPEIIIANFAFISGNAAIAISQKYHVPVVTLEHSSGFMVNSRHLKYMEDVYKKSSKNLAVSSYLSSQIEKRFSVHAEVLPNIVDESVFYIQDKNKYRDFTFISVGRLIEWKQFDLLIEAFGLFHKQNPNSKLIIIGSGDSEQKLIQLAMNLGLEDAVVFKGEVNNEKLAIEYNMSHVFILPSKGETFGVVYIEALACGIPVIATAEGGPREFVNEENGYLVNEVSADAINALMNQIFISYHQYDQNKISKSIIQTYGKAAFCNKINHYINSSSF